MAAFLVLAAFGAMLFVLVWLNLYRLGHYRAFDDEALAVAGAMPQTPPEGVSIRLAEPADIDNGLRESLAALSPAEAATPQMAVALMARKHASARTFVAVVSGRVVGTASLLVEPKLTNDCRPAGHIEDVAVSPSFHGKGIGTALVEHVLRVCKQEGMYKVVLDCDADKVGFYERFGFYRNGVAMRWDASPSVGE